MQKNLVFHYQNVLYNKKEGIYLHEAFSTRSGDLYSVNPLPVEVNGDTSTEVEETLRAMESDSVRYKAVKYKDILKQMERWTDEIEVSQQEEIQLLEDEYDLEEDYYKEDGEVLDLVEYMERNR